MRSRQRKRGRVEKQRAPDGTRRVKAPHPPHETRTSASTGQFLARKERSEDPLRMLASRENRSPNGCRPLVNV